LLIVFQFVNTFLLGSLFLHAALATRSLVVPMAGHALYDFAVIDATARSAGQPPAWSIAVPLLGAALAAGCLWRLSRLPDGEPYPD
jgi:membrane protease YdiL (CAAX protease family)